MVSRGHSPGLEIYDLVQNGNGGLKIDRASSATRKLVEDTVAPDDVEYRDLD